MPKKVQELLESLFAVTCKAGQASGEMHKDGSKKQTLSRAGKRIFIVKGYFTCTYKDSSKRRQPFHSKNLEIYIPGGTKNTQKKTCIDLLQTLESVSKPCALHFVVSR
jgi:hypothetical protein